MTGVCFGLLWFGATVARSSSCRFPLSRFLSIYLLSDFRLLLSLPSSSSPSPVFCLLCPTAQVRLQLNRMDRRPPLLFGRWLRWVILV
ncbi:hypothetical protein BKA80DRAFT_263564, partial [Phyllosticta citrichinensis]